MKTEKQQYLDGVNNLDYWTGTSAHSARTHLFHYYEAKLMALRMGPWKIHFSTKEDYYANVVPLTVPLMFNIRADPFESYDNADSAGHLTQKITWLGQPMTRLMAEHLQSLVEFPPVQGGKSCDMSNVVQQYMKRGHD